MASKHLSNEEFFQHLTSLLASTHQVTHGSIFLTQKSLSPSSPSSPEDSAASKPQTLIRATNGKSKTQRSSKTKLSTVVAGDAAVLTAFYARYAEVCKKGMEGLRKRDKKKAKARRKGKGTAVGVKAG